MEDPPSPNRSASDAKRHSRNASYQRSLPRRSTKGPLDEPDDPLSPPSAHPPPASTIPLPTSPPKPPPRRPTIPPPPPPRSPHPDAKDLTFLLHPSLFHPIPPPLFPSAKDHHTTATTASTRLTSTTSPLPTNPQIFSLYHQRLTSLLHLSHRAIAAREACVFEDVTSPFWHHHHPSSSTSFSDSNIIPWDLRVLVVRLAESGRVVSGLYGLGREARAAIRRVRRSRAGGGGGAEEEEEVKVWKGRLKGLGVAVAEALLEEGDVQGAVAVLSGLMGRDDRSAGDDDAEVARMLVLAYCRMGDVVAARRVLEGAMGEGSAAGGMVELESIVRICEGDFEGAAKQILSRENEGGEMGAGMRNNLAVTHFYQGDIGEAVRLLQGMVDGGAKNEGELRRESIFNLATCLELTGENGVRERKEELVKRVGEQGGGALAGFVRADFKL